MVLISYNNNKACTNNSSNDINIWMYKPSLFINAVNEHLLTACLWEMHPYKERKKVVNKKKNKKRKFKAFTILTTKSATAEPWEKEG